MPRPRQPRSARNTESASNVYGGNAVILYRKAAGLSVDALNMSTKSIRGRQSNRRVLDNFFLPILYEHQIERARQSSMMRTPPTSEEVARELGGLPVRSLHEGVKADVVDVVTAHGDTVVLIDYPDFVDEQTFMAEVARDIIGLPEGYNFRLGSVDAGITIVTGELSDAGTVAVRGAIPPELAFSPVQHDFPE